MFAHDTLVPGSTRNRFQKPKQGRRRSRVTQRSAHRSLNFEKYAADGNQFISRVARELGCDRNYAARVTRAVLHAVRDRIPPDDAVQFAQGLPMAIKGVFFDQYDLSGAPVHIRHPRDFFDFVRFKSGTSGWRDFPHDIDVEDAIAAVFRVLEKTMDYNQVEQIKRTFNDDLAYLFY